MHPGIMAARNEVAAGRIAAAAAILGERAGLDPALLAALKSPINVPAVAALEEREAVADLLEALVGDEPEAPAETKGAKPARKRGKDA